MAPESTDSGSPSETSDRFPARPNEARNFFLLAACMAGVEVTRFFLVGNVGIFVGLAIAFVVAGFWRRANAVVVLHDDHIELATAPLAARRRILFRDVAGWREGPAKPQIDVNTDGASRTFGLPLKLLTETDRALLLTRLRSQLPVSPS